MFATETGPATRSKTGWKLSENRRFLLYLSSRRYRVSCSNSYQVRSERNRLSFFLARFSIHAPPSFNYAIKRNERVPVSVRVRRGAAVGHDEIIVIELSKRIRPVILRGLNLNRGWKESYVPLDSRRIVSRGNYRVLYRTGRTSR